MPRRRPPPPTGGQENHCQRRLQQRNHHQDEPPTNPPPLTPTPFRRRAHRVGVLALFVLGLIFVLASSSVSALHRVLLFGSASAVGSSVGVDVKAVVGDGIGAVEEEEEGAGSSSGKNGGGGGRGSGVVGSDGVRRRQDQDADEAPQPTTGTTTMLRRRREGEPPPEESSLVPQAPAAAASSSGPSSVFGNATVREEARTAAAFASDDPALSSVVDTSSLPPPPPVGHRFPRFGTAEFERRCGWAAAAVPAAVGRGAGRIDAIDGNRGNNCTLLVRPHNESGEGLAQWTSSIVSAHLQSVQVGCDLRIDYGPGIDLAEAIVPPWQLLPSSSSDNSSLPTTSPFVPPDVSCLVAQGSSPDNDGVSNGGCWRAPDADGLRGQPAWHPDDPEVFPRRLIPAAVPSYRYSYGGRLSRRRYRSLSEILTTRKGAGRDVERRATNGTTGRGVTVEMEEKRFVLEDGAACSLGSLIELSPSAGTYVPGLFDRILPALRRAEGNGNEATAPVASSSWPSSPPPSPPLVLALYVRTGYTDKKATAQEKGKRIGKDKGGLGAVGNNVVRCALLIEESHRRRQQSRSKTSISTFTSDAPLLFSASGEGKKEASPLPQSDVVWVIVTDSAAAGRSLVSEYSNNTHRRTVLTTATRGAHSRPRRGPNTSDFVQSFADWYLLGESDAVVTSGKGGSHEAYSFPYMGALRTARPLYDATDGRCELKSMVRA